MIFYNCFFVKYFFWSSNRRDGIYAVHYYQIIFGMGGHTRPEKHWGI